METQVGNIESKVQLILSRLGNYLPLAGGTMTGNIEIGSNAISFDTCKLKTETTFGGLAIKNSAETDFEKMTLTGMIIYGNGSVRWYAGNGDISPWNSDGYYVSLKARDTGVGLKEVARFIGAADPYISFTGIMATIPTNANLPVGFWTIGYVSGGNATLYVNDAGTIKSLVLGAPA